MKEGHINGRGKDLQTSRRRMKGILSKEDEGQCTPKELTVRKRRKINSVISRIFSPFACWSLRAYIPRQNDRACSLFPTRFSQSILRPVPGNKPFDITILPTPVPSADTIHFSQHEASPTTASKQSFKALAIPTVGQYSSLYAQPHYYRVETAFFQNIEGG